MSVDRRGVTDAFLALLRTGTSKPVGDHALPDHTPDQPFAVVYSLPGGGFDGPPLTNPEDSSEFVYQVTSVGVTRQQAEWMADAIRRTVLARSSSGAFQVAIVSPTGVAICGRMGEAPGGVEEEGNLFSVAERFRLVAVPS